MKIEKVTRETQEEREKNPESISITSVAAGDGVILFGFRNFFQN